MKAADLVRDHGDGAEKGNQVFSCCPHDHASGENKPDSMIAMNFDQAENGVYVMLCNLHGTGEEMNGGTLLDQFIQAHDFTQAEFMQYVDRTAEIEIEAAINALGVESNRDAVEQVLRAIAEQVGDLMQDEAWLAAIKQRGPRWCTLNTLRTMLGSYRGEAAPEGEQAPYPEQMRLLRVTVEEGNADNPTLFLRDDGVPMRLSKAGGKTRIEELNHAAWEFEMCKRTNQSLMPYMLTYLKGETHWALPIFDSIHRAHDDDKDSCRSAARCARHRARRRLEPTRAMLLVEHIGERPTGLDRLPQRTDAALAQLRHQCREDVRRRNRVAERRMAIVDLDTEPG